MYGLSFLFSVDYTCSITIFSNFPLSSRVILINGCPLFPVQFDIMFVIVFSGGKLMGCWYVTSSNASHRLLGVTEPPKWYLESMIMKTNLSVTKFTSGNKISIRCLIGHNQNIVPFCEISIQCLLKIGRGNNVLQHSQDRTT